MCVLLKLFTAVYTLQNIGLICDSTACVCLYTCSSETIENEIVFISTNIELIMNHDVHRCIILLTIGFSTTACIFLFWLYYTSTECHAVGRVGIVMLVVKFILELGVD